MRGTRFFWRLKYWLGKAPAFNTLIAQPHRAIMCAAVERFQPGSILDYGCGNGASLFLLRQRNPDVRVEGIDPVEAAIRQARSEFQRRGIDGTFKVGGLKELKQYADDSFDVVTSDAVIFYLPPSQAEQTLAHMRRVARRGVVINTWHSDQGPFRDDETWIYDYSALCPGATIDPYPAGVWKDSRWNKYGVIVSIPSS